MSFLEPVSDGGEKDVCEEHDRNELSRCVHLLIREVAHPSLVVASERERSCEGDEEELPEDGEEEAAFPEEYEIALRLNCAIEE